MLNGIHPLFENQSNTYLQYIAGEGDFQHFDPCVAKEYVAVWQTMGTYTIDSNILTFAQGYHSKSAKVL